MDNAASFMKVMTKMDSGGTPRSRRQRMRLAMVKVFPEPGPANSSTGPSL